MPSLAGLEREPYLFARLCNPLKISQCWSWGPEGPPPAVWGTPGHGFLCHPFDQCITPYQNYHSKTVYLRHQQEEGERQGVVGIQKRKEAGEEGFVGRQAIS